MIEVLRQDYVAFAEAKGLSPRRVLFRHALKNALVPTVTVAAIETGSLLGGNMVVETVFGWPGLGRLVVESIFVRNYPLVQAAVLLYAVTYVLLNFAGRRHLHAPQPEGGAVSAVPVPAPAERGRAGFAAAAWGCRASSRTACRWLPRSWSSSFVLAAAAAPWIAPHDPYETDLLRRLQPPAWLEGGEWAYLLGCDALGRDILSRIVYGARVSIFIGVVVVALATGHRHRCSGLLAGYLRGWTDIAISRVVDILLGFPYLIFAIALMAMMGPGLQNIVLALVYKEWVIPCRLVRGETLAMRADGVRRGGARHRRVARGTSCSREILPNILSPVIVVADHPHGARHHPGGEPVVPRPRRAAAHRVLGLAWWRTGAPSSRMPGGSPPSRVSPSSLLVLAINVASQGLRDAFDPKIND